MVFGTIRFQDHFAFQYLFDPGIDQGGEFQRGDVQQSCGMLGDLLLHGIEGVDVGFFPLGGAFAGEAHSQEGKAVAGDFVGGALFAFVIGVFNLLKIEGVEFGRAIQRFYCSDNVVVTFAEMLGNID